MKLSFTNLNNIDNNNNNNNNSNIKIVIVIVIDSYIIQSPAFHLRTTKSIKTSTELKTL